MTESDQYWAEQRQSYLGVSGLFEALAEEGKARALERIADQDPVREGFAIDSTHPGFPAVAAWVCSTIYCAPPSFVELRPDPWKSPERWRLSVSHAHGAFETYVSTDQVRRLGAKR